MSTATSPMPLTREISSRLAALRHLIRLYVWARGVASCLSLGAAVFWLSLTVDWVFEPSAAVRGGILVLAGLVVFGAVYHWLLSRLLVPLPNRSMAALLERRYGQLGDRLLTVVELSPRSPAVGGFDASMLQQTRAELLKLLPQAEIVPVINFRPLGKALGLALLLVGSVVAFTSWQPSAAQTWFHRSLLLSDAQWPRGTRIVVAGFPQRDGQRLVKVARGSSLTVQAKADTTLAIPDALQIRYQTAEGSQGRPLMTMLKRAVPGRDAYQDFEYVFANVQTDIVFDVVALHGGMFGKNDRVQDLLIQAVASPDLEDVVLRCQYPEYLHQRPEEFSVRLVQPLPEGTAVTILARANKDLVEAAYQVLTDNPDAPRQPLLIASDQPRAIELSLGPLAADTRVVFHLRDSDGVVNQQPIRTLIRIMADQPPQVDISLVGIGKAVTPRASLPLRGTIWDDHGLSRTWFEYQVEGREPQQEDFQLPGGGGGEEDQQEMEFEVEQAAATPGVKLSLRVQAADNYALGPQPQVGSSQQYELQVVTEAELRALLETRERILRRRFEGIMDEMARVRDSLSRLLGQGPPPRSAGLDPPGVPAGGDAPQKQEAEAAGTPSSSPSRLSRQILRTEQALQTSDRMRHETQEVADEFGRILHELEHNQVSFFDEIQQRLGQGIIAPLTEVANQQFPLLDDRLQHLRQVVEDPRARDPAALAARRQVDVLLRQMEEVLQNMLELQKFNELLADLRQIIEAQKQVSQLTVKERERLKQRLKDELRKDLLD